MARKTPAMTDNKGETLFWSIAEKMYADPQVTEGTMMGFKCLRASGAFFATLDHKSNALIVKLPKDRVLSLIEDGIGKPFAPAGRVFKEWVSLQQPDRKLWTKLLDEAKCFVKTS